jgi:hypothetical protein
MKRTPTAGWIRVGLFALPVYGLLIAYSTLKPQPDQVTTRKAGHALSAAVATWWVMSWATCWVPF